MIRLAHILEIDAMWPHLQDGMAIACQKGGAQYTETWLHTLCRRGDAYLVVDLDDGEIRAAVVCQEQNWTGRIVLNCLAACGREMDEWLEPLREFGNRTFRVEKYVFDGRPGWQRTPGVRVLRYVYEVDAGQ